MGVVGVVSGGCHLAGPAAQPLEEQGYENGGNEGCGQHPAHHAGPHGAAGRSPRARGEGQGHHPEHEGQRGHHDGAEAQACRLNRGFGQAQALLERHRLGDARQGDDAALRLLRSYSFSDRCRYYWGEPALVQAVQTLSRLNRTCAGKEDTFILDFRNTPEEIFKAFKPYYEDTPTEPLTDAQHLYRLYHQIEELGLIFEEEVKAFGAVYFKPRRKETVHDHAAMNGILDLAVDRFKERDEEAREEVKALFARNAALRTRAARYVASAGSLLLDSRRAEACSANFEKVRRYVKRLCARTLPRLPEGASASEELRLLSAITPKGPVFYRGTVQALADRYVVFHDDYGAVSRLLLELIRAEALARGYHIITCPCAMHPEDQIDHIFIPALRLAFLTDNLWHPIQLPGVQAVRCTRFVDRENLSGFRARLRFNDRAASELIDQAVALMAQAKNCHDELETYYRAAVDFDQVNAVAANCQKILGLG